VRPGQFGSDDDATREVFFEYLRTEDARRAEAWELEELRSFRFAETPRVGTFRSIRAALRTMEDKQD